MKIKFRPVLLLVFCWVCSWPASAAGSQPIFSRSDPPPGEAEFGHEPPPWPDVADVMAGTLEANVQRWTAQADAGRARAALIAGRYWLEQVPADPQNCAKAIDWLQKADKLGSSEAPGWLGHVYRRYDCPQRDLKTAAAWLRKAVPLLTYGAAGDLRDIYSQTDAPEHDALLAYTYARVENSNPELADQLDAGKRKSATETADKLLADIERRKQELRAAPAEEKLKVAASGAGWNVGLVAFDDLRECTSNTAGNCKGVRRMAYFDAANRGDEYLRCKLALDHREFATGSQATHTRETLLPPKSTRRLIAGRVGEVSAGDLRVECAPVAGLAADVASGRCKATTTGVPSVSDFYPAASRHRGDEGRVLLYVWMDQKQGHPAIVELMGSSGFPELDQAGVKMGSYMAFSTECDRGYLPIAVSFRLEEGG